MDFFWGVGANFLKFLSYFFSCFTKLKLRKNNVLKQFLDQGIFFWRGGAIFLEIFKSSFFLFWRNRNWEKIIFLAGGWFFLGGRQFCWNLILVNFLFWDKIIFWNNFVSHYVRPRTHNMCAHALRLNQHLNLKWPETHYKSVNIYNH